MYIQPNTTIRLLTGVPLDKTYTNTLYFSSKENQTDYFITKSKHTLTNLTYQRVNKGVCRVERSADVCYDCNYMMFQNTSYGAKWFYAFITKVEYVSNTVCEIYFDIDVIQTWFFNFTLKECFVEREHSLTDNRGDNILPEPVELGEYMLEHYSKISNWFDVQCVIVGVLATVENEVVGNVYDNVYGGLTYVAFISTDTETINSYLENYITTPDNVVVIFTVPAICMLENLPEKGKPTIVLSNTQGWRNTLEPLTSSFNNKFGNYTPKNKKLLTYPYMYYHIDNNNGGSLNLRFEFFENNTPKLQFDSTMSMPVRISCRPSSYKGAENGINTEVITLEDYPICSWSADSYSVWLAQNFAKTSMKLASGVAQTVIGGSMLATGNIGGIGAIASGTLGAFDTIKRYKQEKYDASISGDLLRGNFNNSNLNVSHNMQSFYHAQCKITEEYARTIDDFFSVFGYSCQRVKKPNINSRPHWNYVKTSNCNIVGNMPTDDIDKICGIFNRGITFWKKGNEVGNYSLDNSPT